MNKVSQQKDFRHLRSDPRIVFKQPQGSLTLSIDTDDLVLTCLYPLCNANAK
jgi:hypothetical protein